MTSSPVSRSIPNRGRPKAGRRLFGLPWRCAGLRKGIRRHRRSSLCSRPTISRSPKTQRVESLREQPPGAGPRARDRTPNECHEHNRQCADEDRCNNATFRQDGRQGYRRFEKLEIAHMQRGQTGHNEAEQCGHLVRSHGSFCRVHGENRSRKISRKIVARQYHFCRAHLPCGVSVLGCRDCRQRICGRLALPRVVGRRCISAESLTCRGVVKPPLFAGHGGDRLDSRTSTGTLIGWNLLIVTMGGCPRARLFARPQLHRTPAKMRPAAEGVRARRGTPKLRDGVSGMALHTIPVGFTDR